MTFHSRFEGIAARISNPEYRTRYQVGGFRKEGK